MFQILISINNIANGLLLSAVPDVPINLTALNVDETSVRLQWKSPTTSNGIILDYTVSLNTEFQHIALLKGNITLESRLEGTKINRENNT